MLLKIRYTKKYMIKKILFFILIYAMALNYGVSWSDDSFEDNAILKIQDIKANKAAVNQYDKFELTLQISTIYPHDLDIKATFIDPSLNKIVIKGFPYHENYTVRFTPTKIGEYSYKVEVSDNTETINSVFHKFTCSSSAGAEKGFLKKWPTNPHRLVFDDGSHFYILGENRMNIYIPSWNYEDKDTEEYVKYMSQNGMTTLRVFIRNAENVDDGEQHGYLEPKLGSYDESAADELDAIIQACEKYDVYLILTVFSLGFTPGDNFKNWNDNPYSKANGGPCKNKEAFFTNEKAIYFQEKKLEYIINRYGYSPHLLAIDLLNEPEWDGAFEENLWIPWAIARGNFVKKIDPYGHLVTLGSVGPQWNINGNEDDWYDSEANDAIQWHLYGVHNYKRIAYEMRNFIRKYWDKNKPIFCGEFSWGGEDKATYDHTHNGIWSALLSGGGVLAHSAPLFTPESDELMTPERAKHFKSLSDFLNGVDWGRNLEFRTQEILAKPSFLGVWCLKNEDYVLLWLLDGSSKYGQSIEGADITLSRMPGKSYVVEWWDTREGNIVDRQVIKAENNLFTVKAPPFSKDIAGKIYQVE